MSFQSRGGGNKDGNNSNFRPMFRGGASHHRGEEEGEIGEAMEPGMSSGGGGRMMNNNSKNSGGMGGAMFSNRGGSSSSFGDMERPMMERGFSGGHSGSNNNTSGDGPSRDRGGNLLPPPPVDRLERGFSGGGGGGAGPYGPSVSDRSGGRGGLGGAGRPHRGGRGGWGAPPPSQQQPNKSGPPTSPMGGGSSRGPPGVDSSKGPPPLPDGRFPPPFHLPPSAPQLHRSPSHGKAPPIMRQGSFGGSSGRGIGGRVGGMDGRGRGGCRGGKGRGRFSSYGRDSFTNRSMSFSEDDAGGNDRGSSGWGQPHPSKQSDGIDSFNRGGLPIDRVQSRDEFRGGMDRGPSRDFDHRRGGGDNFGDRGMIPDRSRSNDNLPGPASDTGIQRQRSEDAGKVFGGGGGRGGDFGGRGFGAGRGRPDYGGHSPAPRGWGNRNMSGGGGRGFGARGGGAGGGRGRGGGGGGGGPDFGGRRGSSYSSLADSRANNDFLRASPTRGKQVHASFSSMGSVDDEQGPPPRAPFLGRSTAEQQDHRALFQSDHDRRGSHSEHDRRGSHSEQERLRRGPYGSHSSDERSKMSDGAGQQPKGETPLHVASSSDAVAAAAASIALQKAAHPKRPSDPRAALANSQSSSYASMAGPSDPRKNHGDAKKPNTAKSDSGLLTVSALDDPVKGKEILVELAEIVKRPDLLNTSMSASSQGQLLPSKPLIMKAMALLDVKLKQSQATLSNLEEELKVEVSKEEAEEAARAEEERKLMEEEKKKQAELLAKSREEERRRKEEQWELEKEQMEKDLEEKLAEQKEVLAKKTAEIEAAIPFRVAKEEERLRKQYSDKEESALKSIRAPLDEAVKKVEEEAVQAKLVVDAEEAKLKELSEVYRSKLNPPGATASSSTDIVPKDDFEMASLIATINRENRARAKQAHEEAKNELLPVLQPTSPDSGTNLPPRDPKYGLTDSEWQERTRQVTGLANAIYTEPSQHPYYEQVEETGKKLKPVMTKYIRAKQKKLKRRWTELAEEYVGHKQIYEKQTAKKNLKGKKATSGSKSRGHRASILNIDGSSSASSRPAEQPASATTTPTTGRSSNPYRRPRRGQGAVSVGDVVRSDYEQDLIIAEITAKEAMEKRIAHGGSKLPRQVCDEESRLTARFINTFSHQKVDDPIEQERKQSLINTWTDMEKAVFLDRFLQYPKDFRKISTFLRNKSTKDCVAFYYNSKQSVPYKAALKEHLMRRKRRGEYHQWEATIQAALAVGTTVKAGESEDKPLVFMLPPDDNSYHTFKLHPMKREVFDQLNASGDSYDEEAISEEISSRKKRKRTKDPLFILDPKQRKFLKPSPQELAKQRAEEDTGASATAPGRSTSPVPPESTSASTGPGRKPHKWTTEDKRRFHETLEAHGRNWEMLAAVIGTKTDKQIKNFYYDQKKQGSRKASSQPTTATVAAPATDTPQETKPVPEAPKEETKQAEATASSMVRTSEADATTARYNEMLAQRDAALLEAARMAEQEQQQQQHQANIIRQLKEQAAQEQFRQLLNQQQQQHQQQQHLAQQLSAHDEMRRLIAQSSQTHQNPLSNLSGFLPWTSLAALEQQQQQPDTRSYLTDTANLQQLLALHQHQQNHQQNHQQQQQGQQHQQHGFAADALAALAGLATRHHHSQPSSAAEALLQQMQQQQHGSASTPSPATGFDAQAVLGAAAAAANFGSAPVGAGPFGAGGGGGGGNAAATASALSILARASGGDFHHHHPGARGHPHHRDGSGS